MGKHEKPVSGTSRKSEARLPRAERTPSVREEELLFDIPETAERVTARAAETLPEEPAAPVPAESFEAPSPIPEESFEAPAPIRRAARPAQEAAPVRRERPVSEEKRVRRERPAQDSEPVRRERPAQENKPVRRERPVQEDKPARRERPAPEEKPARRERPAQETKSARRERPARAENPAADEEIVPKNRKKKGGFRKGLLTYVLVVAVIFLAALIVLWVALARFQKNKDAEKAAEAEQNAIVLQEKQHAEAVRQAPQRAFEAWLASYTADDWTNLWYEKRPENIDGRDRVRAYMEERFGSDSVQAFRSLDYTDEAPAYVLKDGDEALARVTLSGSDVNWAVSDVELELEGTKSASVEVAVGSKVFCNGIELGSEYAGETQNNFSYEPLKDKLINPVSWTTYKVDGLLIEPELTAEPPAGCSVTKTAEGDFMLCLDGADAEKYTTRAVSFVKAYLTYYMNGYNGTWGNLYAALAYLTPGTQAYTDLQDTYNGVVWNTAYGNIDVSNTTASGVVIWADNCYSVDVTYDANCTHNGQAIDYADATMRIYFLQTDAGFVISNYETL